MSTVDAFAGGLITVVGETIAVAWLTCGELPKVGLTLIAMFALNFVVAVALASFAVAKIVFRTTGVTIASFLRLIK
jgi:hypothetical protein